MGTVGICLNGIVSTNFSRKVTSYNTIFGVKCVIVLSFFMTLVTGSNFKTVPPGLYFGSRTSESASEVLG